MNYFFLLIMLFLTSFASAQELNCIVSVDGSQIQTQEKQIFAQIKNDFQDFLNTRRWTEDEFEPVERINCNITILLTSANVNEGVYSGNAQIEASRPVYGTDYETTTFSYIDQSFDFIYQPGIDMTFNPNSFTTNLVSTLGFYAYMIIGYDYDSFGELGGQSFFETARTIANAVPAGVSDGWNQTGNPNNRWNLVDQVNNPQLDSLRISFYQYHRLGMDQFNKNIDSTYKTLISVLVQADKLRNTLPLSIYLESLFQAKNSELIKVFKPAPLSIREEVIELLKKADPSNLDKYQEIQSF